MTEATAQPAAAPQSEKKPAAGPPPLDFTKVEALRKHMLLTTAQMAKVLGVSRVTYSGWINGRSIRKKNADKVRNELRKLLVILTEHAWPTPHVIAMESDKRWEVLQETLKELEAAQEAE